MTMQLVHTKSPAHKKANIPQNSKKNPVLHPVIQLHSQIGNIGMMNLLQSSVIQTKPKPSQANLDVETSNRVLEGSGVPIETSVRKQMESKFNYNFSNIRIHKDSQAQKMTASVGADAFTTGRDIFFGQNRYEPSSKEGLGLLAHELTHVVQQDGKTHHTQMSPAVIESGDSFEMEANSAAISVLENRPVQVTKKVSRTPIQRGLWGWVKSAAKSVGSAISRGVEAVGDLASQGIQWLAENVPVVGDIKRVLKKAGDVVGTILGDPVGFLRNLLSAIKGGFSQFADNIWEHLKAGAVQWLFGTMAEAGIQIPKSFDLKSIFGFILQVLGLTAARLRQKAVKIIGEKNMAILEKVWQYVSTLISEGPKGLWEIVKQDASMLIDLALDSIKSWIVTTVIKKAVVKLASMFNPVGAVVQALIMIYDVVTFVIEKAKQIAALVEAVINSIGMIAAGNIKPASDWIEQTLARLIPVAIGFLASLLGLGGISKTIKGIIGNIQGRVDAIVDKALKKIIGTILKATKSVGNVAMGGLSAVKEFFFPSHSFEAGGDTHRIFAEESGSEIVTMIQSRPQTLAKFLDSKKTTTDKKKKQAVTDAIQIMKAVNKKQKTLVELQKDKESKKSNAAKINKITNEIIAQQIELGKKLQIIMRGEGVDKINKYAFEGMFGTYESTVKQKGDLLTPDHQPQASLIKHVASKLPTAKIKQIAGGHAKGGFTVNLFSKRHERTYTYRDNKVASERKGKIDDIIIKDNDTKSQKKKVANYLIKARDEDAGHVESRILKVSEEDKDIWGDIQDISSDKDETKKNVQQIKRQIRKGESSIKQTDSEIRDWLK